MTIDQFIETCLQRNGDYLVRGRAAVVNSDADRLNKKTLSGEWSPAQIYQHLILANTPYVALMTEAADKLPLDPSNLLMKTTWLGGLIARQAGPGTNAPAPRPMIPAEEHYDPTIVETWATQYAELISIIGRAKGRNINLKYVRNPFLPIFKMSMTDCILILTNHTERHIVQIEERLAGSC